MSQILLFIITLIAAIHDTKCLVPAKFQWKILDYAWKHNNTRQKAIDDGSYIPENNMPTGLARWRDKLFITVPRWKKGVPSSLNYVLLNGPQMQPLRPYPSWREAYVDATGRIPSNSTVVSAFRIAVDDRNRLWVADNGVTDMASEVKQIAAPAILVFDLHTDRLLHKYVFGDELTSASVLTSIRVKGTTSYEERIFHFGVDPLIRAGCQHSEQRTHFLEVVDDTCGCDNSTFAYVTDSGSNAVLVYDQLFGAAWRVASPRLRGEPAAAVHRVGGVEFYWSDGVSGAALSPSKRDGSRDLYMQSTSSTKTFKISTAVLTNRNTTEDEKYNGLKVVGDRGPNSQATACAVDPTSNIMFFTQLNRNGISCWNMDKPFSPENTPLVISDCNLLEFPNDVKVDKEGTLWILSDRQSRFLYGRLEPGQVNFRVLAAPAATVVRGSACAPPSRAASIRNLFRRRRPGNFRVLAAPAAAVVRGSACAAPSRVGSTRNLFRRRRSAS